MKVWTLPAVNWPQLRKKLALAPPGPMTALNVSGTMLRVAQAVPRPGGAEITRVAAEALDLPAEAEANDATALGRAIATALDKLRLKRSEIVMGVPRSSVVLRTLTLPALSNLRELASMVHFQVAKDLPFHPDDAVIDFRVRRSNGASSLARLANANGKTNEEAEPSVEKVEVLVAAVQREVVEFYQKTAEAAGRKLAALGLLSYANARSLEACRVAQGNETVALVLLRETDFSIDVIAEQSLLFSRDAKIPKPGEPVMSLAPEVNGNGVVPAAPSEAAPTVTEQPASTEASAPAAPAPAPVPPPPLDPVEAVTMEVIRSLTGYAGGEPNHPVARLVIAGDTGREAMLVEALQKRLSFPCEQLEVAERLDLPRAGQQHASGALSALGLALGMLDRGGLPFDFLRPKRPAVQRDMRRVRLLMGAAAAVAVLAFVMAVRTQVLKRKDAELTTLRAQVRQQQKELPLYKQMKLQAAKTREWVAESRNWLEHYAWLSAVLPPSQEVYLSSFVVGGSGTNLSLAVQARSSTVLAKLDKQLRQAGYDLRPLAVNPGADRYGYNFRSTIELTVPRSMQIDLNKAHPPARPPDDVSLGGAAGARKGAGS